VDSGFRLLIGNRAVTFKEKADVARAFNVRIVAPWDWGQRKTAFRLAQQVIRAAMCTVCYAAYQPRVRMQLCSLYQTAS
jgi:hypothetical protein